MLPHLFFFIFVPPDIYLLIILNTHYIMLQSSVGHIVRERVQFCVQVTITAQKDQILVDVTSVCICGFCNRNGRGKWILSASGCRGPCSLHRCLLCLGDWNSWCYRKRLGHVCLFLVSEGVMAKNMFFCHCQFQSHIIQSVVNYQHFLWPNNCEQKVNLHLLFSILKTALKA